MDINKIRKDFPILETTVHKKPLVYLDNGATMQVPVKVLDAVEEQYRLYQANIHRGIHYLSETSTSRVEKVRKKVCEFIGAECPEEIIFTSGTTQSINIAARSFCEAFVGAGDTVVTTELEHHSDFIPWQEAAKRQGARFEIVHIDEKGDLRMDELEELLKLGPKIVAVTCVSNVIGTVTPIKDIIEKAHAAGAKVLLDGAQAMKHIKFDVRELDCDFLCFSGHKIMAPTGVGILYGKKELLEKMPPVIFGGGMVDTVEAHESTYGELPFKFEAGTANIAGIIGLGAAIEYIEEIGFEEIAEREAELVKYTSEKLSALNGIRVLGAPEKRAGAISFNFEKMHYFDAAKLLDQLGIAVRSGHHCAQPLLRAFGCEGAVRVTPAFYNTFEEIDKLEAGIKKILLLAENAGL